MKKIYRLITTYTDGTMEITGHYYNEQDAENALKVLMNEVPSFEKERWFKSGNITTMEVPDKTESISNGQETWQIY